MNKNPEHICGMLAIQCVHIVYITIVSVLLACYTIGNWDIHE